MTLTELAKRADLSRPTVKKRLIELKEREIIKDPFMIYQPETMGLTKVNVFCDTNDFDSLTILEQLGTIHPYTHYRGRIIGKKFGLFIQFNIPKGTIHLLEELFTWLKNENLISDFKIVQSAGKRLRIFPDLNKFNPHTSTWDFSWQKWFADLHLYSSSFSDNTPKPCDFDDFKETHFHILRDLTNNASLQQKDLREKYGLSKAEMSRQYNYVMDNFISSVRHHYNREIFELTETYLILVHSVPESKKNQLYNKLKAISPPFDLSYDIIENGDLFFWINMSTKQSIEFAFNTWTHLENVEIYLLDTRPKSSVMYLFYPENFDFDTLEWKKTNEYMLEQPIHRLTKFIRNKA